MAPQHVHPYYALWAMARGMRGVVLPERRVTTRFEFPDRPLKQRRFWLVVRRPEPEVCVKPPGFEEDLVVTTDAEWLARWVMGQATLGGGMKARRVDVEGPQRLVRTLKAWGEQGAHALMTWGTKSTATQT